MEARTGSIRMRVSSLEGAEIRSAAQSIIEREQIKGETNKQPGIRDVLLFLIRDYQSRS